MNDYQKIENSICTYCGGNLVTKKGGEHKDCLNCGTHYWYRDTGPGYWSNTGPANWYKINKAKEDFSKDFPGLNTDKIFEWFANRHAIFDE